MAQSRIAMPIERAVPATVFSAALRSSVLRSGSLRLATSRTWALVNVAIGRPLGRWEPFVSPAASRSSAEVGGVLVTRAKDPSSR
jgi:hypothetical protein